MIIFQAIYCPLPTCHESQICDLYTQPRIFQGRLLPHKACFKLQRSGVFKEFPDRDMIFAIFFFCFWPLRCSTPTLKVCWWTSELPFTPSPGNILTLFLRVFECLNKFVQPWTYWIAAKCQQCRPTWPLRQQKRLFQFSCGLGHLTQVYQIATYVGHDSLRSLSLWGITQQVPTILIRL